MATKNSVNVGLSGIQGSGTFFGSTSGTLVSPIIDISSATSISFSSTSEVIGTTTNDNAAAGSVGEFVSSIVPFASKVALTTSAVNSIATVSLTSGDWDIWGNIGYTGGATTKFTSLLFWAGTGAGIPVSSSYNVISYGTTGIVAFGQGNISINVPTVRFSLAGTTSINLNARAKFTLSSCSAYGGIYARRVR